jgi:hypothetical protein
MQAESLAESLLYCPEKHRRAQAFLLVFHGSQGFSYCLVASRAMGTGIRPATLLQVVERGGGEVA